MNKSKDAPNMRPCVNRNSCYASAKAIKGNRLLEPAAQQRGEEDYQDADGADPAQQEDHRANGDVA